MKKILLLLILAVGLSEAARAASASFHAGMESQISRNVVSPSFFPILKLGGNHSDERSKIDLELKMSMAHPKVYAFSSRNFYYSFPSHNESILKFDFGRKWIGWSDVDEIWGLGAIQPLDSWDRLRSFSQGLTGMFMNLETESIKLQLFGSYLFAPEVTPNIIIENYEFKLYHPQSVAAGPRTFDILNRPAPLAYTLTIPKTSSIIFRPSIMISAATKNKKFINAKATVGHLPLNYFPAAILQPIITPSVQGEVYVTPRLLSHNIYSTEITYDFNENFKTGYSMLWDYLIAENTLPSSATKTSLSTTMYLSPWVRFENFIISYLYSEGGIGEDSNPYTNVSQNMFSSRVLYRNAAMISSKIKDFSLKYTHEFSINADWIAADWNYNWNTSWNTVFGFDIISAEKTMSSKRGAEFLADLRAVDRIRIGVNYVF